MFSNSLRLQHAEIGEVIATIRQRVQSPDSIDSGSAIALRKCLVELSGLVTFHLATEDRVLYPKLLERGDPRTKAAAKQFAAEMGSIGALFKEYLSHWRSGAAISQDTKRFVSETTSMLSALMIRMDREEREVYPMFDSLASS